MLLCAGEDFSGKRSGNGAAHKVRNGQSPSTGESEDGDMFPGEKVPGLEQGR